MGNCFSGLHIPLCCSLLPLGQLSLHCQLVPETQTVILLQVVLLLLYWHQGIGKCGVVLPFPLVFLKSSRATIQIL